MSAAHRLTILIEEYAPGTVTSTSLGFLTVHQWRGSFLQRKLADSSAPDARSVHQAFSRGDGTVDVAGAARAGIALERVIHHDRRRAAIRAGRIPGALNAREAYEITRRFGGAR
ncbi:hypothetical protein ACFVAJ_18855 [Agromyces sp. NPDC057679]|uniref:hypothetical protein n=1 Tax=Agromyces sp. NPDC057679 TaxID=3346207 RepID=UPI00366CA078